MAYCSAIGNVNVLEIMGTELFDEAQENPHLLKAAAASTPIKRRSPAPTAAHSPIRVTKNVAGVPLPLNDDNNNAHAKALYQQLQAIAQQHAVPSRNPSHSRVSPSRSPSKPGQVGADLPFIPFGSGAQPFALAWQAMQSPTPMQTTPPLSPTSPDTIDLNVYDSEIHKLLYSLNRFGLANDRAMDNSAAQAYPPPPPTSPTQYSSSSLWLPGSPRTDPLASPVSYRSNDSATLKAMKKKKRANNQRRQIKKRKANRQTNEDENGATARGSVTFATVKHLLRGGGLTSRLVRRPETDFRRKTMGTVCSRMKRRSKFQRPTILTDAYHRVSNMRLGTNPMKAKVKHVAFPYTWKEPDYSYEADPGMPSPRGALKRDSLINLETLDKIGTRAACPVHLIDEEIPDYSQVQARVDSYNHMPRPNKTLRRPSAWLLGATPISTH